MNLEEVKDIVIARLDWKDDKTITGFTLPTTNPVSGRFFNDEHPAVTLENIRDCQPVEDLIDADFIAYLGQLKERCTRQVLANVFRKDFVADDLMALYPTAFDNALSLRMVIIVGEIIMTSTRTNEISRITEGFLGKLNYDIYRDTVQKFASNSTMYRHTMGIATRYDLEIQDIQRRFGTEERMIKTITKGAASNRWFINDSDYYEPPLK